jgi:hypothetical protein
MLYHAPMGIASMVIGIVALVIGFIPFCGFWAAVPALVGLILGIVDLALKSKRGQPRGTAIAGVVLNPLAIIVVVAWWYLAYSFGSEVATAPVVSGYNSAWSQFPPAQQQPAMQPMQPMQPVPVTPPVPPAPPPGQTP